MKLNTKLTTITFLVAALVTLLIISVSWSNIVSTTENNVSQQLKALTQTVHSTAATAAYLNNIELGEEVLKGLNANRIVDCAEIVTTTLTITGDKRCLATDYVKQNLFSPFDSQEIVGLIKISPDKSAIKALSREIFSNQIINILIIIALITTAIWISTYLVVTKPLANLAKDVKHIDASSEDFPRLRKNNRHDEIGTISAVVNELLDDISQRLGKEKNLLRETRQLGQNLKTLFDLSDNAIAVTDEKLNVITCNPEFSELFFNKGVVQHDASWTKIFFKDCEELLQTVLNANVCEQAQAIEVEMTTGDGDHHESLWFEVTFMKTRSREHDDIESTNILFYINDVTDHKLRLAHSEREANHDALTQLMNRRSASRQLRFKLEDKDVSEVAILMIDLDGFKPVNDRYGHEAGDMVLQTIAHRLAKSTRKSDILSRWGGDEFLVGLVNTNEKQAKKIAEKILSDIVEPVLFKNKKLDKEQMLKVGASIGIAVGNREKSDFMTLIDQADKAMYSVKHATKSAVSVYDSSSKYGT